MGYVVVRVTAPDEEPLSSLDTERDAVDHVRTIEAAGIPDAVHHEVRAGSGRAVWTTEAGELERVV